MYLSRSIKLLPATLAQQGYLSHSPPMSDVRLQALHLVGQPVDFLLRPQNIAQVHLVAVETVMAGRGAGQEGGGARGGGDGRDGKHRRIGSGRRGVLGGEAELLDFFL